MPKATTMTEAAADPLKITPIEGEPFRFHVSSRSEPEAPRLVDLEPFNWNGWCGCPGFLHYLPRLERKARPSDATRCRHLKEVREQFLQQVLPMLKRHWPRPEFKQS